jgi:predicted small secreted protein
MVIKKNTVLIIIFLLVVSVWLGGCATAKGVATGVATGMSETAKGAAKDAKGLWQGILNLDAWIKKNLW